MIILDTNVISEAMRATPDASVASWLHSQPPFELATTTINVAELKFGIARLSPGPRRADLEARFDDLVQRGLLRRVLGFDAAAGDAFAELAASRQRSGRPLVGFDGLIAAIAVSRGLAIATRDVRGFEDCGIEVVNPWEPVST
ncbi:MAG TPA: type II toxin-antitoxin system VapC family toxin [Stellaceae bacterium]|nr:type II toxin-antitoxin system VapC family toxin [Stellaceae bacterium]